MFVGHPICQMVSNQLGAEGRNVLVRMVHYKAASARKQQRKAKDVAKVGTGSPAK